MTTRRWTGLKGALAAAFAFALFGNASPRDAFKGPAYLLIRGGGLDRPVLVHHGPRAGGWDPGASALMGILASLTSSSEPIPDPQGPRYYEVLEFWGGSPWTPLPSADGTPSEPLVPERASVVSRIYPDEPGGPVWNPHTGMVRIGERELDGNLTPLPPLQSAGPYRTISDTGREILESFGLRFGS